MGRGVVGRVGRRVAAGRYVAGRGVGGLGGRLHVTAGLRCFRLGFAPRPRGCVAPKRSEPAHAAPATRSRRPRPRKFGGDAPNAGADGVDELRESPSSGSLGRGRYCVSTESCTEDDAASQQRLVQRTTLRPSSVLCRDDSASPSHKTLRLSSVLFSSVVLWAPAEAVHCANVWRFTLEFSVFLCNAERSFQRSRLQGRLVQK